MPVFIKNRPRDPAVKIPQSRPPVKPGMLASHCCGGMGLAVHLDGYHICAQARWN